MTIIGSLAAAEPGPVQSCVRTMRAAVSPSAGWTWGAVLLAMLVVGAQPGSAEAIIPATVLIPAGEFIAGSDGEEREAAYRLDEAAYGHSLTRQRRWYDDERPRQVVTLPDYRITLTPITNAQYQGFVDATGHPWPAVTREEWQSFGLIHPYERALRHAWRSRRAPAGREAHPVVLVSYEDAEAYGRWLSERTGETWRLPSEIEWEKAARGSDGRRFPWGNEFDPQRLNSHDAGPFDTLPVGSFPQSASPYGALDMAGQVFEWTATPAGPGRHVVKGGSWDDKGCGVCRPAASHSRPDRLKHILIGFRLVRQ